MKRLPLRTLAALLLLAVIVASVATAIGTLIVTRATIARLVDRRITEESLSIVEAGRILPTSLLVRRIEDAARRRDTGDIGFVLARDDGRALVGNVVLHRPLPLGYSNLTSGDRIEGLTHGRALVRAVGEGRVLTTLAETEPIQDLNSIRVLIVTGGFASVILIVSGGLTLFGRIISHRITRMQRTVDAIIDGDMNERVPVDGLGSELDQQAQAFNRMLDRIATLMASISNVTHDIAHDLRTPLARLRALLALTYREAGDTQTSDRLAKALAEVDQILAMFGAILRIAEVEGGNRRAGFKPFDLAALLEETAALYEPLAEEEGHLLLLDAPMPEVTLHGDRQLVAQALINLVENAIRHTPAGTRIQLRLESANAAVRVIVEDDGPGIAPSQHGKALSRFGRLEEARGSDGHGLGLPLVEGIARLHRGAVTLVDAEPGLRAVMTLPIAPGLVKGRA